MSAFILRNFILALCEYIKVQEISSWNISNWYLDIIREISKKHSNECLFYFIWILYLVPMVTYHLPVLYFSLSIRNTFVFVT